MKFDFEKHTPKEEVVPQAEKTQEQFDAEIMQEADKLGTNIEKLNQEINALGGPEKFKEIFSEKNDYYPNQYGENVTVGDRYVKQDREVVHSKNETAKQNAKFSALLALAPILAYIGERVAYGESDASQYSITYAVMSIPALGVAISSILNKIKARSFERKAKRMELKMKMTDTPHEAN